MANINDYLKWRGDILLSQEYPFNQVDSMIMSRFSYLIFNKIEMENEETIESISEKMKNFPNEDFLFNGDKELITNLGQSKRFKDLKVTDYIKTTEKEVEKQFGAITVHLNNLEMVISYIGTDATIIGWKEDFNMAFMDDVPCQVAGEDYLHKLAMKYPQKKIRIVGHSKGGNVAIYAAMKTSKDIQKRIIKVNNYDGPGFSEEFLSKIESGIENKIETFVPQDSIIGRILNHREKMTICVSNQKGIMQHDLYSWEVIGTKPIYARRLTDASDKLDAAAKKWLEITTTEQRKEFIDLVFDLVYSTDTNTFAEMRNNKSNYVKIIDSYRKIPKEERKLMTEMVRKFVTLYMESFKDRKKDS